MSDTLFESENIVYIQLSDGRVGYIEEATLTDERFLNDLKRNGLTYELTNADHYLKYQLLTQLSPEALYFARSGKVFERKDWVKGVK